MKAILLPYSENQNEPSRPLKKIIDLDAIPTGARDVFLKAVFIEHVCHVNPDKLIIREGNSNDYGDLVVEHPMGLYLYVTYVKE